MLWPFGYYMYNFNVIAIGRNSSFIFFSLTANKYNCELCKTIKDSIIPKCVWSLGFCVGLYSDGTAAMTGKHSGLVTQFKELVPECKSTFCFLHQERSQLNIGNS